MRRLLPLLVVGLAAASVPARAQDLERVQLRDPSELEGLLGEQWYGVYFQGIKSGWAHTRCARGGTPESPVFVHTSEFKAELRSNGQQTAFELREEQIYEGRPPYGLRGAVSHMVQDQARAERRLEPRPGGWSLVASVDGGAPRAVNVPAFDYTLVDELAASLWIRRRPAVGARLVHPSLQVDQGELHTEIVTVQALEERRTEGVALPVWRVKWVNQADESGTQLLDAQGVVLTADMQGVCEMRLEPEAQAKQLQASGDLFQAGRVALDRPLDDPPPGSPSRLVRLRLRVEGEARDRVRAGPLQQVEPAGEALLLTVDVKQGPRPPASVEEQQAALRSLAADPDEAARLLALARQAVGDARTPAEQVQRLVHFVAGYLADAYELGSLSLTQVIERKRGDCTEHAALFTALARAAGIPARTVLGVAWLGDAARAFGGHNWCEVVLDGAWLPVDPTLDQDPIDAGHVRLGQEGGPSGLGSRDALRFTLIDLQREE